MNRVLDTVGKIKVVDLFPYKIKDINNFLFRDHIPFNPNKPESVKYWREFVRDCVEGKWIDDNGTWVWMMPKLFFYINAGTVEIERPDVPRHLGSPDMRDNEWIILTYLLCCDKFSGFMGDTEFTCNDTVRRIQEGEELPESVVGRAKTHCLKADGEWKEYVDPWEYLTVHYLITYPAKEPLGLPLYENESRNGAIIGARFSAKTFCCSAADFVHTFLFNGARYFEQLKTNLKIEIFTGAADSIYLNKFLKVAENCISNLPGGEEGYPSPLYREHTGQWSDERTPIQQVFVDKVSGKKYGSRSEIIKGVFQGHRNFVVVSRRYLRFYADEFGLIPRAKTVHGAADSSMKTGGRRIGSVIYSGTGGSIEHIKEPQEIFQNPKGFDIFSIPNYWGNMAPQGLFIPTSYCQEDFKNKNGTSNLIAATNHVLKIRAELESESQASVLANRKMNEPLDPTEPFLSADVNIFPQENLADRISVLESYLWKTRAKTVELDITKDRKVVVRDNLSALSNAIKNLNDDEQSGECVMYEPPMVEDEELKYRHNLYKVVYDTVSDKLFDEALKQKRGSKKPSWAAITVIKETPRRLGTNDLRSTVVFEFVGRRHNPDDHHKIALAACILYNATCLFESNVGNVISYFQRYDCERYLQPTPWTFIEKNSPHAERKTTYGVTMNTDLKSRCLKYTNSWAREIFQVPIVGEPFTNIDNLWSLRLLYEMLFFGEGNFDALSAFLLYMLWRQDELELQETDAEVEEQNKDMEELENFAFNYRYE